MYKKSHVLLLITTVILYYPLSTWAWNADKTHKEMSESAAENSVLSTAHGDYLKSLGFNKNTEEEFMLGSETRTVKKWIGQGGIDEDSGSAFNGRFYNHFQDPTKAWNGAGLSSSWFWIKNGKSAVLWAVDDSSNDWRWAKVRDYYYAALTSGTEVDRSSNYAKTFKGLGQIIHLIQDMAQPAHVRNDPHPADDSGWMPGLEYWGQKHPNDAKNIASSPIFPAVNLNISNGGYAPITQFFDTDQYDETNPSAILTQGLAEYTNANFFSDDTIFYYPYPSKKTSVTIEEKDYADIINPGSFVKRQYYMKTADGETGYRLAAVDYLNFYRESHLDPTQQEVVKTIGLMDDYVHEDYAQKLIPRAVGYSAGLLNYFFRGKIYMEKDPQNVGKYIIKNESAEKMEGTFALYYDDVAESRKAVPGASWTLTINPNSQSTPVTFTEPTSPAPKEKGKYILAFNGKLGMEEGAVLGKIVQLRNEVNGRIVYISPTDNLVTVKLKGASLHTVVPEMHKAKSVRFDINNPDRFGVLIQSTEYKDKVQIFKIDIENEIINLEKTVEFDFPNIQTQFPNGFRHSCCQCSDCNRYEWREQLNHYERWDVFDFFLKGSNIKPFGIFRKFIDHIFIVEGLSPDSLGYPLDYNNSHGIFYGSHNVVVESIKSGSGGFFNIINAVGDGYTGAACHNYTENCRVEFKAGGIVIESPLYYFRSLTILNEDNFLYNIRESFDPPSYRFKENKADIPLQLPQYDLEWYKQRIPSMLREDGNYSFTFNPFSYSSEIGKVNCSGYLIGKNNIGFAVDGYFAGNIVEFSSCNDIKTLEYIGRPESAIFDVILY